MDDSLESFFIDYIVICKKTYIRGWYLFKFCVLLFITSSAVFSPRRSVVMPQKQRRNHHILPQNDVIILWIENIITVTTYRSLLKVINNCHRGLRIYRQYGSVRQVQTAWKSNNKSQKYNVNTKFQKKIKIGQDFCESVKFNMTLYAIYISEEIFFFLNNT